MGGTAKSGYMPPEKGPFKCANCTHLKEGGCDSPAVQQDLGTNDKGLAPVKSQGCCNFFNPKKLNHIKLAGRK